jgi:hypothetical protein
MVAELAQCFQVYFPKGMTAADLLPRLASKNVVIAGGLHAAIKGQSLHLSCQDQQS